MLDIIYGCENPSHDLRWLVIYRDPDDPDDPWAICVLGSRRDAEIALKALPETGIDFDSPFAENDRQWKAFGGREAVDKFVFERLRW